MYVVDTWTGRHASALRAALRLTIDQFAETLGTSARAVAKWGADPSMVPLPELQSALDTLLAQSPEAAQQRFAMRVEREADGRRGVSRRAVLGGALVGLAVPALAPDDLRHLAAAISNASRYLDLEAVAHFRTVLTECTSDDGALGPRLVVSNVLGLLAAVENVARDALPTTRAELLKVGAEAAEFAGFLYRDLGIPELADHWRDRAMEWARERGDRQMEGYVLLRKSQAAWDERDGRRMMSLAEAVDGRRRDLPYRVQAEVAQQQARAMAMLGAGTVAVESKLDLARELFARDDEVTGLANHYREPVLQAQAALCFTELGQAARAVELFDLALASETFSYRDHGYFTSQLALAHAANGDGEQAATVAMRAVPVARTTSSVRTQRELFRLVDGLAGARGSAVRELRHELAAGF